MSGEATPTTIAVERRTPDEMRADDPSPATDPATVERLIESELLVEDVSIDGMCGVY